MIRVAVLVILAFGATATALFTIPGSPDLVFRVSWLAAFVAAFFLHGFIRRYWIAAVLTVCAANAVSHGYHLVRTGELVPITIGVTMVHTFVIALAIGIPFSLRRAFPPPAERCHYCGEGPIESTFAVCPHCGELMDHA